MSLLCQCVTYVNEFCVLSKMAGELELQEQESLFAMPTLDQGAGSGGTMRLP